MTKLKKSLSIRLLIAGLTFPCIQSCSTVDATTGRCKKFVEPKYVAAIADTDGKPWQMKLSPEVVDLKCDYETGQSAPVGYMTFSVAILDGQGVAKPGLAVNARFSGATPLGTKETEAGFYQDPYQYLRDTSGNIIDTGDTKNLKDQNQSNLDDKSTDSCGVAVFRVKWVCPAPKKSIGGTFYVESGPLFSKSVKVTLEHVVQMQPITTVPSSIAPN